MSLFGFGLIGVLISQRPFRHREEQLCEDRRLQREEGFVERVAGTRDAARSYGMPQAAEQEEARRWSSVRGHKQQ